ncbi:hypothetical protein PGH12_12005 [Chryseobacterium wangxinyae]|uniref:hypothetical protein n=1 Tax=Chryseobacterium sp. CY350 TaxID=2997336 RepID=UPI002270C11C|nr:hypothetical protein [Chryseobacterium sp. CY350]MCY0976205.1 hypothetical protein [Chryseobacterium sp. CY350]WBZ94197.1 hypothetical protein PGH12_12005 [Chryseobacterium sp. CY350]
MENPHNIDRMTTLSQVMERLRERGIHREFRMNEDHEMKYEDSEKNYKPDELTILKTYRFEGDSNPDDSAVLYLIEDNTGNKGILIDSYGADSNYSGQEFDTFLREIPINESDEYNFD